MRRLMKGRHLLFLYEVLLIASWLENAHRRRPRLQRPAPGYDPRSDQKNTYNDESLEGL